MAERPIFVPLKDGPSFVKEVSFEIKWASGFAVVQKQKNIQALHTAAAKSGYDRLLEISTKSDEIAGKHLSAFHLKVETKIGKIPLECAFQASKVFERGGPFTDLSECDPREAKRDPRLQNSGRLTGFDFEGRKFPLEPKTVFYDWLYINSIYEHRSWLIDRLTCKATYAGFTDIEFNPNKSINCQARSCALFVSLMQRGLLDEAVASPEAFINTVSSSPTRSKSAVDAHQQFSLLNA